MNKKVALVILDGWGHGDHSKSDGIYNADTPFMDELEASQPTAELLTDGEHVGLPHGQMGNSEVGHLNIGAGRIVYQELSRINKSIEDGDFFQQSVLVDAMKLAKERDSSLHFIGLVSDGGVHSSLEHLKALCTMAQSFDLNQVFIHAFTDGRDCDPESGKGQLEDLENHLKKSTGKVASVIGRYYAMDRDKRWERVKKAYDLLTKGVGQQFSSSAEAIQSSYQNGITDEFIEASSIVENGAPVATISNGDVVICFNFRTDRCREITQVLSQQNFPEFEMSALDLHYVTMTSYDDTYKNVHVIFEKENLKNTLGEVLSGHGLKQLRIAETEKYPHVTFFFSGGREETFDGEERIVIASPKVATYDLQPEMSAPEVRNAACNYMKDVTPDFICLNFANADMVGHTGVYSAILEAAHRVDDCLKTVVETGKSLGYSFIIIADHGNSDYAINPDGSPNTAHSMNPVPVVVIDDRVAAIKNGTLRDVAPTVLHLLGLEKVDEMTGSSLVSF